MEENKDSRENEIAALTKSQKEAFNYIGNWGPISSLCCYVHKGSVKALIKKGLTQVSSNCIDYELTAKGKKLFRSHDPNPPK